ncbi:glycoside hydrolase family 1 protein [Flavobacterium selenitireducens]|uniref:hypothetical protein n=1 Tax=Flavobacterium selenitireducens TaxID=2722704 RepID=UPI00168A9F8C|nr:hypothetical protein [Flavobacterium selenitireducens]MBD3581277.1 hypothetical protein [Flavobacterium selenitireducens]
MAIFKSFLMGGFECADHVNRSGDRINLLKETQHDLRVEDDYIALTKLGINVVREGICWSAVELAPGLFDFSEVGNRMSCAEKHGIQQIWDLIHFGYPDGLYPTHPHFCDRFEQLCIAFADFHSAFSQQQLFVVPINEISFLSWHSGDARGTVPFAVNSGWDMKYHLAKAAILGIRALKETVPDCRIVLVEPLVKIHGTLGQDALEVFEMNEHQFQAMDIIAGRICPELGGSEDYLDILGFNYYWNCQWEIGTGSLPWPEESFNRRTDLSQLLGLAYARYQKPMFLSETGHFGIGRVEWLSEILAECHKAIRAGVPLLGMCIYPVIDRPDWDDLSVYFDCGIYDLDRNKNRIPHEGSLKTILLMQKMIGHQQSHYPEDQNASANTKIDTNGTDQDNYRNHLQHI